MTDAPGDILLVVGSDEDADRSGGKVAIAGLTDLHRLLGSDTPPILQLTARFGDQQRDIDLSRFRCVMNLITEPELNPRVLGTLGELLGEFEGLVLNHPRTVLRSKRDQVAQTLAGIDGLRVPRAVRLAPGEDAAATIRSAGLPFPALLRVAGAHTGTFVGRHETLDDLLAGLPERGEHLLTEFVDFRSPDGLYRKYRIFWIGERMVFRHMLVAEEWNVHARARDELMIRRPDLIAEEEALFTAPSGVFPSNVIETLRAVRERITLDFFGIDFAILPGGELLLFEANATMNFFPFRRDHRFAYLLRAIDPAQQALRALLGLPSRTGGIVMGDTIGQMGS